MLVPSRNTIKLYTSFGYYHVYNRGVAKQTIFVDHQDKEHFLKILKRHLDPNDSSKKADGVVYRKFDKDIELLCYCLMGNHVHLLVSTGDEGVSLTAFMRSVMTAYTMYFNKRHKRVGPLFQSVYKASLISSEAYLVHISRYIHLNPRRYKTYRFSSLRFYSEGSQVNWINARLVLSWENFTYNDYLEFLADYEGHKMMLDEIKYELADMDVTRFHSLKGETL